MARTISLNFRKAITDQMSEEIAVCLISFRDSNNATILRISTDPTQRLSSDPLLYGTISNGLTYRFAPLMVQLPDDIDEKAPRATFAIENVSRDLVAGLRSGINQGTCDIKICLAATPDTIDIDYPDFDILSCTFNQEILQIEVGLTALDDEPYPKGNFTPSGFPGIFN